MGSSPWQHTPVMTKEVVEFLCPASGRVFIDCTLGGGGHVLAIKRFAHDLKIYGFDRDTAALDAAKENLASFQDIVYIQDNFRSLDQHVKEKVDGVLFDLGVSSHQINLGERGFSFQQDGPLDMRMGAGAELDAAKIINTWPADELLHLLNEYGEDRFSKRIGRAICRAREEGDITTTAALREIVEKATPTWKKRESVARVFQALRIAVNDELNSLRSALPAAVALLKPGGRIVVLSYHSLEDRIVKNYFREKAQNGILKIMTKKPLTPEAAEIEVNPRAASAKLRAAAKL